jgi:hypothetical protein
MLLVVYVNQDMWECHQIADQNVFSMQTVQATWLVFSKNVGILVQVLVEETLIAKSSLIDPHVLVLLAILVIHILQAVHPNK